MAFIKNQHQPERLIYGVGTSLKQWQQSETLNQLPVCDVARTFPAKQRVLIIAPHPDDEILGCAGLIQKLAKLKREVVLVAITNGTMSHPNSSYYTPEMLNQIRPQESLQALKMLDLDIHIERIALNIMDGQITNHTDLLYQALQNITRPDDILITTYEMDGHPDHEVAGQVVKYFAQQHELFCYRVFIWAWHWAEPDHPSLNLEQCFKIELDWAEVEQKRRAITCFQSQCVADPSTDQAPILSLFTIERILQPFEVYCYG
ncbi:PIG-L deacetylase family protein [Acinetobacter ihumii]|uniref:PIG-L deacetylase family protein n=1 Tax=Acinetobacter ihumii TaxID=2483802 RepID=UPI00103243BA|nr:PIG-L family deacetylase [Acinetobacter ihumii]